MSVVCDRCRQVLQLFLLGPMLILSACQDDLCKSQPPALEVTITLAGSVKANYEKIKTLRVDLTSATTFHKNWSFQITDELDDGEASFAVALGPAGEGGFSATVEVQAFNALGQEVAQTKKTFPGNSGDACNFRTLELGRWADGGPGADAGDSGSDISDAGVDRSPDQVKPDTTPDMPADMAIPDTASPDTASPDSMLPDMTPPDLCPSSGDFSGSKKTCAGGCDDNKSCTADICSGCVCYNVVKVGSCLIGGGCYKAGASDPKDKCKRCTPTTNATSWTFSTAPGCVTTLAGDGINGSTNGPAASARFYDPSGVAVDEVGRIYVSDYYNHKLRAIHDGLVSDWGAFHSYSPEGVTADRFGTVYVANFIFHQIETVASGIKGNPIGTKIFGGPTGVAVDNKGVVFVADYGYHVIYKIETRNNNKISLFAGTQKTLGYSNSAPVLFHHPSGVAVDNKGSVFVADQGNHVIRRIWIKDGKVSTIAGVAKQTGGPKTNKLNKPTRVAVNNTGRVYVSDSGNNVIRQLQLDYSANKVGVLGPRAGTGTAGFADGEAHKVAMFNGPRGLTVDAFGRVHVADRLNHKVRTVHTVGYWVPLTKNKFKMGSPSSEPFRNGAVEAQHDVTLTHDFEIHTTEVTQDQFHTVMKYNPSSFKYCGGTCPVETVSWHEAVAYCNALSKRKNRTPCFTCSGSKATTKCSEVAKYAGTKIYTCPGYRLPTEAEWEYAYRAGTKTAFYNGNSTATSSSVPSPLVNEIGWYCHNSKVKYAGGQSTNCTGTIKEHGPHPVGAKKPNAWGLYDMAGNVLEWCHDGFAKVLGTATDPVTVVPGSSQRMIRGGAWNRGWPALRAAARGYNASAKNDLGFRCVRSSN